MVFDFLCRARVERSTTVAVLCVVGFFSLAKASSVGVLRIILALRVCHWSYIMQIGVLIDFYSLFFLFCRFIFFCL